MLKQRLLTAFLLIPLVVWALLALPTSIMQWLVALVALLAGREWLQIIGFTGKQGLLALLGGLVAAILLIRLLPPAVLLAMAGLIWLAALLLVMRYAHRPLTPSLQTLFTHRAFGWLMALLILSAFAGSAIRIHGLSAQGPLLLLAVLVAVWLADTGGYVAGKRYGRHKLASVISPNKTWEGVFGALVFSALWAVLSGYWLADSGIGLAVWLPIVLLTVLMSVVGDLFESVFKRCFHVKDSGQLLPGHGGMLDRVDSLMAAVPFAAILLALAGVS